MGNTFTRRQTAAVQGLGDIGPRAAVPRLLEIIETDDTDDNRYHAEEAAKALKRIDPAAAAEVGVK